MGIRVDGLDEFERKMLDIAEKFPEARDKFLKQEAELIKSRAKMNTPVDTGRLRNTWERTQPANCSIEVYNNAEYAAHVEYGHRQKKRWVPGYWKGGHFIYDPGAKTGMMLKERFIDGARMLHEAMAETNLSIRSDAKAILGGLFK